MKLLALVFVALVLPTCLHARRVRGGRADPPAAKDDKMAAAMKMVGAAMAGLPKAAPKGPAPPPGLTKVGNHSVLDVGFGAFEVEVAKMAADALGKLNATGNVTEEGQKATKNAFKEAFRPVKMEVAKSWTQLRPEKRDLFVMKVKAQFAGIFKDGRPSVSKALDSHLTLLWSTKKGGDPVELVASSLSAPLKRLGSRLHDYEDLVYMSNIFVKFQEKHHRTKAQLSTLEAGAEVWVQ